MPELIGKLQATFKSTLHPSPLFTRKICVTFFEDLTVLSLCLVSTIAVPCKYYRCCIVLTYIVFGVTFTCCQKD